LFCKSPTGHWMLRVSLSIKESLFLLGSKVSQCILFACNILAPSSLLLLLLPLFLLLDNWDGSNVTYWGWAGGNCAHTHPAFTARTCSILQ
jgi:hypothetical protein